MGAGRRVTAVLHLLMAADLAVMLLGRPVPDRLGYQAALFVLAAHWFVLRAVACPRHRAAELHQALGAAAMAWMTRPHHHAIAHSPLDTLTAAVLLASALWWLARARRARPFAIVEPLPAYAESLAACAHAATAATMGLMLL